MLREVASAHFALTCATAPDQRLPLQVALIRDWRKAGVAGGGTADAATAKRIPIVTTATTADAGELVAPYTRRWPCQENIIKDWLLLVGLDTNHGFAKTVVTNSETHRRQTALTQQIANCARWADAARQMSLTTTVRYRRQWTKIRDQIRARDRAVALQERELEVAGTTRTAIPALLATYAESWNAARATLEDRQGQAYRQSNAARQKAESYRQKQTRLTHAIAARVARERPMAEVDNAKDQVMSVLKVALANLGMWLRDH